MMSLDKVLEEIKTKAIESSVPEETWERFDEELEKTLNQVKDSNNLKELIDQGIEAIRYGLENKVPDPVDAGYTILHNVVERFFNYVKQEHSKILEARDMAYKVIDRYSENQDWKYAVGRAALYLMTIYPYQSKEDKSKIENIVRTLDHKMINDEFLGEIWNGYKREFLNML